MATIKPLLPLVVATCINIIGLGALIPILPFQVTALGGGEDVAPLIYSVFSAAALLTAPLWGRFSDRIGRRPVLLLSIAMTLLATLWLAAASALWEVFAARAFAGAAAGWLACAQATVCDLTDEKNRAKGLGLLGAAFGLGFTIGPALGGLGVGDAANPNYAWPALIAAGCAALTLLVTFIWVREPPRLRRGSAPRLSRALMHNPGLLRIMLLYFLVLMAFSAVEGVFAVWAAIRFDLGARDVSWYLVFAGIVSIVVQGGGVGRLSPVLGEARLVVIAILLLIGAFVAMILVPSPIWILLPMGLLAAGIGLHNPAMQSLMSRLAPEAMRGGVMGTAQSAMSLARIVGPAWAGLALGQGGADAPFVIGLLLLCLALAGGVTLSRHHPHERDKERG